MIEHELQALEECGVKAIRCQSSDGIAMIDEALTRLGSDENPSGVGLTHLMLEGGAGLLGSFAAANQIDECHVYLGGKLIGGQSASGPIGDPGFQSLADATLFQMREVHSFGNDVRMIYRRLDAMGPG
jgi:diaminohydroxyphosphoribosylaminopyrimidine deaminase/5-amino-6-(5-phosphoribosylamino)uracil reductase